MSGQEYPNRPIRLVTAGLGTGGDFAARLIAQGISGPLGQQVIVENRASGNITGEIVAKAPPDGYTLLLFGGGLWLAPFLDDKTPYDPVRDFSPIALATSAPNLMVVHPSLPVKSVKELIALAKAKPGVLNYGSGGTAASSHLAAELFKALAGVDILRINYKSAGAALNDLIAGQVQLAFGTAGSLVPHAKSGRLRILGVTSAQPSALLPGLPTVAASVPGYEAGTISAIFAPAKTSDSIINRLNQEIVRGINRPEIKEKFTNAGVEVIGGSPDQLAAYVKADMSKMGKVIKDAGIKVD